VKFFLVGFGLQNQFFKKKLDIFFKDFKKMTKRRFEGETAGYIYLMTKRKKDDKRDIGKLSGIYTRWLVQAPFLFDEHGTQMYDVTPRCRTMIVNGGYVLQLDDPQLTMLEFIDPESGKQEYAPALPIAFQQNKDKHISVLYRWMKPDMEFDGQNVVDNFFLKDEDSALPFYAVCGIVYQLAPRAIEMFLPRYKLVVSRYLQTLRENEMQSLTLNYVLELYICQPYLLWRTRLGQFLYKQKIMPFASQVSSKYRRIARKLVKSATFVVEQKTNLETCICQQNTALFEANLLFEKNTHVYHVCHTCLEHLQKIVHVCDTIRTIRNFPFAKFHEHFSKMKTLLNHL